MTLEERKKAFIKEFSLLCRKHRLTIDGTDGGAFIRTEEKWSRKANNYVEVNSKYWDTFEWEEYTGPG